MPKPSDKIYVPPWLPSIVKDQYVNYMVRKTLKALIKEGRVKDEGDGTYSMVDKKDDKTS